MEKYLDPMSIWAATISWARQWAERNHRTLDIGRHIQLFIYVSEKTGAYYMHGPKLYWDEVVGDGYFGNTDADGLKQNQKRLTHVILSGGPFPREEPYMWSTFDLFLDDIFPSGK